MPRAKCLPACLLTLLPASLLAAGEPGAVLHMTRTRAVEGDTIRVNVEVSNVGRIFSREFPKVEGLEILSTGHEIVSVTAGGGAKNSVIFHYVVTPLRAGTYTLGPATIKTDRGVLTTRTAELVVAKPSSNGNAGPQKPVSIEVMIEPEGEVFLHQPVLVTWRLIIPYMDINQYSISIPWLHEFKGFRSIDPDDLQGKADRGRTAGLLEVLASGRKTLMTEDTRTTEGARKRVLEVKRLLVPIETGEFVLGASQAMLQLVVGRKAGRDPFGFPSIFDEQLITKTHDAVSPSHILKVLPLPEKGRPIDFSGAVGEFSLDAEVTPRECAQGDTVTLLVRIEGKGDLELVPVPKVPQGKGYKVLDPEIDSSFASPTQGTKTFRFPIYIAEDGNVELPQVAFSYFDADQQRYQTHVAGPFLVRARPGRPGRVVPFGGRTGEAKRGVFKAGQDISDIVTDVEILQDQSPLFLRTSPVLLLLTAAAAAMAAGWFGRHRRIVSADPALMRRREAWPLLRDALREAPTAQSAYSAFRRYLADISGGSVGAEAAAEKAAEVVLNETADRRLASDTSALLIQMEHALFRPDAPSPTDEVCAISDLAKRIEKARRRR